MASVCPHPKPTVFPAWLLHRTTWIRKWQPKLAGMSVDEFVNLTRRSTSRSSPTNRRGACWYRQTRPDAFSENLSSFEGAVAVLGQYTTTPGEVI